MKPNEAYKHALRDKKNMDEFHKKHLVGKNKNNSNLVFVIKNHLYIENILDSILVNLLPKGELLTKMTFSNKLKVIESFHIHENKDLVQLIHELNKLRNKFSHNIDYKISKKDLEKCIKITGISKNLAIREQLERTTSYLVGYLNALATISRLFPLGTVLINFQNIFKKDKNYNKDLIKDIYSWDDMSSALDAMHL